MECPWLHRVLQENHTLVVDHQRPHPQAEEFLKENFEMANAVCQPVVSMGQAMGLLLSLNRRPEFVFRDDALELLKLFSKQIAIAVENDTLLRRAEELRVVDDLTGLYNAPYMRNRLEEEVKRAICYNRPCALVLLDMDGFLRLQDAHGILTGEKALRHLADFLRTQVNEVDRVGRIGPDEFALILPEKNKREAIEMAESICTGIGRRVFKDVVSGVTFRVTVSAGVSENPLDGSSGQELHGKAAEAVARAKREGGNRVVAG